LTAARIHLALAGRGAVDLNSKALPEVIAELRPAHNAKTAEPPRTSTQTPTTRPALSRPMTPDLARLLTLLITANPSPTPGPRNP